MALFWSHILIVALVLVLLFGKGKLSVFMGDVAQGIKSFKKGVADDDEPNRRLWTNEKTYSLAEQILMSAFRAPTTFVQSALVFLGSARSRGVVSLASETTSRAISATSPQRNKPATSEVAQSWHSSKRQRMEARLSVRRAFCDAGFGDKAYLRMKNEKLCFSCRTSCSGQSLHGLWSVRTGIRPN